MYGTNINRNMTRALITLLRIVLSNLLETLPLILKFWCDMIKSLHLEYFYSKTIFLANKTIKLHYVFKNIGFSHSINYSFVWMFVLEQVNYLLISYVD